MADTTAIKTRIEPYVRQWLSLQFPGRVFTERQVTLVSGSHYRFDAVSEDNQIVAAILSNRPKTRTGRENTGGVRKAMDDIGWLQELPENVSKIMIFTDSGFRDLIRKRSERKGMDDIRMMVCSLPKDLAELLQQTLDKASQEQRAAE